MERKKGSQVVSFLPAPPVLSPYIHVFPHGGRIHECFLLIPTAHTEEQKQSNHNYHSYHPHPSLLSPIFFTFSTRGADHSRKGFLVAQHRYTPLNVHIVVLVNQPIHYIPSCLPPCTNLFVAWNGAKKVLLAVHTGDEVSKLHKPAAHSVG